jgi:hypothetical protein
VLWAHAVAYRPNEMRQRRAYRLALLGETSTRGLSAEKRGSSIADQDTIAPLRQGLAGFSVTRAKGLMMDGYGSEDGFNNC